MQGFFGRFGIGAVCILVISPCTDSVPSGLGGGGTTTTTTGTTYETEYDLALKRWQANAPAHYAIVYKHTCECTVEMQRPTRVTVRRTGESETIEDVADAGSPSDTVSDDRREAAKTVNGLFDLITQALALNPADPRITYDGTIGYPVSINIDPSSGSGDAYKVTSFQALP